MLKKIFNDIKKHKNYIIYQAKAEIKSDLTGSYLGMLWIVIEPLAFMLIYMFIGEVVFNTTTEFYPIFIFTGLMFWNFFSNVLRKSTKLLQSYKEIVKRIYVPKYIFLIISILVNLFQLFITFILLFIFMFIYSVPLSINLLWVLPLVLNLMLITFGISTFFMHFGVIITDLVNITNILLKFLFYFAGIFYSIQDRIPTPYSTLLYYANPITFLISEFRESFIYSTSINISVYFIWLFIGCILSYFGIKLIDKYENTYVKVMR